MGRQLLDYAKAHGLTPQGILRHTYLEGPPQHKDPAKFITRSFCQSCNGISHSAYLHTRQSCLQQTLQKLIPARAGRVQKRRPLSVSKKSFASLSKVFRTL